MKRLTSFPYYGGKFHLVPVLRAMIPPHKTYVEVFCGAANFLLNKDRSNVEVINDLNSFITTFFKVLRDEETRAIFYDRLQYVPFSREVFNEEKKKYLEGKFKDDVDKAICWFVGVRQSMAGIPFKSWKVGKSPVVKLANVWENSKELLLILAARLKGVSIENYSFEKILSIYDSEYIFTYCDPPYIGVQRIEKDVYEFEMDEALHIRLLKLALKSKGMFLISGYVNDLYEDYLKDWGRIDIKSKNWAKIQSKENYKDTGRGSKVETLWFNYIISDKRLVAKFGDTINIVR